MAYVLPTLNIDVNIWPSNAVPPVGAPSVQCKANLAWGKRTAVPSTGGTATLGVVLMTMTLLLPKATNIFGDPDLNVCCCVEAPAGTARFYLVAFVDDIGRGFANEHRAAILVQKLPWPIPIP